MNECNVDNRTIFLHDNLDVLQHINSDCIDLIYLDPPFNKNKTFSAPIGSSAEGAEFSDIFREEDLKSEWLQTIQEDQPELHQYLNGIRGVGKHYNFAYLSYMAIRLIECQRILKSSGSIYLHCDPTMSHYLKTTMDCIFGEDQYRNEIIWRRTNAHPLSIRKFESITDTILYYAKSKNFQFHGVQAEMSSDQIAALYTQKDEFGRFTTTDLSGGKAGGVEAYQAFNSVFPPKGRAWAPPQLSKLPAWVQDSIDPNYSDLNQLEKCHALDNIGLIYWTKNNKPRLKRYLDGTPTQSVPNLWTDVVVPSGAERTGFPTQKPLALLERIIEASSNEGDIVLDPFCGCATTCIAAERLERLWIGIDVSHKAYDLVKERLDKEVARPDELFGEQVHLTTKLPVLLGESLGETKHVYIISHPNYPGEYKVGIAKNVKARLNAYQTSDPDRAYKLEFSHETHLFRKTEKHIHDTFDNKHEWVSGDMKEIKREIVEFSKAS